MPWMVVMILLTLLDTLSSEVACIRLADIYWNATNPIFRIDNTDHIIDVNKHHLPFEYDQVNIICPVYSHATDSTDSDTGDDEEQYIIYNVSKEEYDSCRITNPNPRIIAVCDKPNQLMYFTITFRSFTPQPGGLEFLPGNDYYFVSTSTGDPGGLHQRVGGRCATHNMKVIFKVCCNPSSKGIEDGTSSNHKTAAVNASTPVSAAPPATHNTSSRPSESNKPFDRNHPSSPASSPTLAPSSKGVRPGAPPSRMPPPPYYLKPYEVPIEDEMDRSPPPSDKNKDEVAKSPKRERAKNEKLENSGPLHRWSHPIGAYYCVAACLLHHLLRLLYR